MLEQLKLMLGIEDADKDKLLTQLITMATARLKILLGNIEPPESMEYIIVEVAVKRYNRIGSEGFENHTVEGESIAFTDSDFAEFAEEIQSFLDMQKDSTRGKLRFI